MCACLALPQVYKEKHPKSEPHQQGRRKSGRPSFRYTGGDADFTDSSDDDTTAPLSSLKAAALALKAVKEEEIVVEDDTAAVAKEAAAVAAREGGGGEDTTSDAGSEGSSAEAGKRGGGRGLGKGKRAGGDTSRKGKRARVVDVAEGGRRVVDVCTGFDRVEPPPSLFGGRSCEDRWYCRGRCSLANCSARIQRVDCGVCLFSSLICVLVCGGSAKYRAAPGPSQPRVGASPAVVPASLALDLLV